MIILLNGPPSSGKDTAAEFITLMVGNSKVHHLKMSRPLKHGLCSIFDFNGTEVNALESYKDESNGPDYGNLSYRQMQIQLFRHLEETYGEDVLGTLFVRAAKQVMKPHIVVSDAGVSVELEPIKKAYPF